MSIRQTSFILALVFCIYACKSGKSDKENMNDLKDSVAEIITIPETDTITKINQPDNTSVKQTEPEIVKYEYTGEMMMKGGVWIIRATLADKSTTDFLPDHLAAEFKVEGLKVEFNGKPGTIPPNVRMAGRPIAITDIKKVE